MIRDIGGDQAFANDLSAHIAERRIIKTLIALRCARGRSQADVAAKMGCSQGRISKLESSMDEDIRVGDIRGYARALGLTTIVGLENSGSRSVDLVKHHAGCIKRLVDNLARMGKSDLVVAEGVAKFFGEAAFNLLNMLDQATKELPPEVHNHGVNVEVVGPDDEGCTGGREDEETAPRKPRTPKKRNGMQPA